MIINIFKNETLYKELEKYNQDIIDIDNKFINQYPLEKISYWFNPKNVRSLPLSRTSPNPDPTVQNKPQYNLILYASNYLSIFLIDLLYKDKKDICIEDFGAGDGRLIYYLSKFGYHNFSAWDSWTQTVESLFNEMMKYGVIEPKINEPNTKPIVVNSAGAPFVFITHGFDDRDKEIATHNLPVNYYNIHRDRDISSVELVTFYTNRHWENILAPMFLPKRGFKYLCRDADDLSIAYCREEKYDEFKERLKEYEINTSI